MREVPIRAGLEHAQLSSDGGCPQDCNKNRDNKTELRQGGKKSNWESKRMVSYDKGLISYRRVLKVRTARWMSSMGRTNQADCWLQYDLSGGLSAVLNEGIDRFNENKK